LVSDTEMVSVEVSVPEGDRVADPSDNVPVIVSDGEAENVKVPFVDEAVLESDSVSVADNVPTVRDLEMERVADSVSAWVLVGASLAVADHVGEKAVTVIEEL
jgi:hypothetical protein